MIDITGLTFYNLTALHPTHRLDNRRNMIWVWQCSCGEITEQSAYAVKHGRVKSCGHLKITNSIGVRNRLEAGEAAFNWLFGQYKSNARWRGKSFELDRGIFRELVTSPCFYCGRKPSQKMKRKTIFGEFLYNGIDRVDNSRGYVAGNVVSCCRTCNMMKKDLGQEEFLSAVHSIHTHLGL